MALWICPRQVAVLPIAEAQRDYAHEVAEKLQKATPCKLCMNVKDDRKTLKKRVREAQVVSSNILLRLVTRNRHRGASIFEDGITKHMVRKSDRH